MVLDPLTAANATLAATEKIPQDELSFAQDREQFLARVTQLYMRGTPVAIIAESLKVDRDKVMDGLKKLRKRWSSTHIDVTHDDRVAEQLAKIDHMEQVAWNAYYLSCGESFETILSCMQQVLAPKSETPVQVNSAQVKRSWTSKGGNDKFLGRVCWCIETRLKLLKVLETDKITNNVVNIDWSQLFTERPRVTSADAIDDRIKALTNGHAETNG